MFHNREDAALQLAERLKGRRLRDPLVLAVPCGGVVTGVVLARQLGAEFDVILARKLKAPGMPELAFGAVAENGAVYLNHPTGLFVGPLSLHLARECRFQKEEIARSRRLFRAGQPPAPVKGRSVIVTDEGIATASTMIAALKGLQIQHPHEVIVAVPVAPPERLDAVRRWCDEVVCLHAPDDFWAVGAYYEDFAHVENEQVVELLRGSSRPTRAAGAGNEPLPQPPAGGCGPAGGPADAPGGGGPRASCPRKAVPTSLCRVRRRTMLPIQTILHPTDFSPSSEAAFPLACSLARDYGARLVVLHVAPPPVVAYGETITALVDEDTVEAARESLRRLRAPEPKVPIEHRVEVGDAAERILGVADEIGCSLIVLGTHGRTGLGRLLMGSVAEAVSRRAPCPVLTAKTPLRGAAAAAAPYEEVVNA